MISTLQRLFGAFLGKKRRGPAPGTPVTLKELDQSIRAYGALIEAHSVHGLAVFDEETLPVRKSRLEIVLTVAIENASDENEADALAAAMIGLADYQIGVGPEPIQMMATVSDFDELQVRKDILEPAKSQARLAQYGDYNSYRTRIADDNKRLIALAAAALARRRKREQGNRA